MDVGGLWVLIVILCTTDAVAVQNILITLKQVNSFLETTE